MESDADFAVVIEGNEIETSRADHIRKFMEGEGVFEEDGPDDEQAVEGKLDMGEGEFRLGEGCHGEDSLSIIGDLGFIWMRKWDYFVSPSLFSEESSDVLRFFASIIVPMHIPMLRPMGI